METCDSAIESASSVLGEKMPDFNDLGGDGKLLASLAYAYLSSQENKVK